MDPKLAATLQKLKKLRERKDLSIKPTPLLKTKIVGLDGIERDLKLRYYQIQMILHLLAMKRFVVGDDTGLGKCCLGGTYINTSSGMVQIKDMQPGAMQPDTFHPLRGWQVDTGQGLASIKNFYYGGVKPTILLQTRYGFGVGGSWVHPVQVLRDGVHTFVPLQDIRVGDYLCVHRDKAFFPSLDPDLPAPSDEQFGCRTVPHGNPPRLTPKLSRLLGYIVGEAWVNSPYTISISQSETKNSEVYQDIYNLCESLWPGAFHQHRNQIQASSVQIRACLEGLGIKQVLSSEKTVPDPIFLATRESTCEFLRGLFEGEAGVLSSGGIEFTTSSEEMGKQVQLLLLRFGIVSKRSPKKVKTYPDKTYWRLTLFGDDAQRFADEIGFISTRKQIALQSCLNRPQNTNHDVIPGVKQLFEQVRSDLLQTTSRLGTNSNRIGSGLKQFGVSLVNSLNNIRNYNRNPSYNFVAKVVEILERAAPETKPLDSLRAFLSTRYFYDPVVAIETGQEEVFDIEIEDPKHCFVGNGLINHNTCEAIGALAYTWQFTPDMKVIVLTKKSVVEQWSEEFEKFTHGVQTFVAKGTPKQRSKAYQEYMAAQGPSVLIMGYRAAVQDFSQLQEWMGYSLILDEITVVKNPSTQVHQVCRHLGHQAERVWGLTATLIKNHLMEGFGIYQVVVPGLFGQTKNAFMQDYCITRLQPLPGGRKVPVIVGYRQTDIDRFRDKIEPYYLGRPKHEVAEELPILITRDIRVGMTPFQKEKYQEALDGLLAFGDGEEKETDRLTALIYCQEIANHPCLIGFEDSDSKKMEALVDILSEGDLEDEKVIIFTRFRKLVDWAVPYLAKKGIKSVRVTGSEDESERKAAQDAFQDFKSDTRVVWITMAGGEAINLQAAKAMIFYDTPWSAGDFIQILGRMIRIGSLHDRVYALHLIANETIDEKVQEVVRKKRKLIEAVLGERVRGEKGQSIQFDVVSDTREIFNGLLADAKKRKQK